MHRDEKLLFSSFYSYMYIFVYMCANVLLKPTVLKSFSHILLIKFVIIMIIHIYIAFYHFKALSI